MLIAFTLLNNYDYAFLNYVFENIIQNIIRKWLKEYNYKKYYKKDFIKNERWRDTNTLNYIVFNNEHIL